MTRVINRHLHVEGRDDWFRNPLTWLCGGIAVGAVLQGWLLVALSAAVMAVPANLQVDYESTENLNTNPNQ